MTKTRAKWFRPPGGKPVYEPQRAPRVRPPVVPDERRRYPVPIDPSDRPYDPRRTPETEPGFDPRFKPKPSPARPVKPMPKIPRVPHMPRLPSPRPFRPSPFIIPTLVDWIWPSIPERPKYLPIPAGWIRTHGPYPYIDPNNIWPKNNPPFIHSLQEYGGYIEFQSIPHHVGPIPGWWPKMGIWHCYDNLAHTVHRHDNYERWVRPDGVYADAPLDFSFPGAPRMGAWQQPYNPNVERWLPTFPDPWAPKPAPQLEPGTATPEVKNPDSPYDPDHAWQYDPIFGLAPGVMAPPITNTPPLTPAPVGVAPIPPVQREPPQKGERQRKALARSKVVALAVYKALDWSSEAAEVVDAIYQALPKKVRDRWEKDRGAYWRFNEQRGKWEKAGLDRPGDQFGQYGLEGADWKLQAIYHNMHQLDIEQAFKNIVKNHLEDMVIGGMQRGLPNNTGNAHAEGEREVAKWLDDIFSSEFGL